jgi:hypothetical protein
LTLLLVLLLLLHLLLKVLLLTLWRSSARHHIQTYRHRKQVLWFVSIKAQLVLRSMQKNQSVDMARDQGLVHTWYNS